MWRPKRRLVINNSLAIISFNVKLTYLPGSFGTTMLRSVRVVS